jgi:hypothetical protein
MPRRKNFNSQQILLLLLAILGKYHRVFYADALIPELTWYFILHIDTEGVIGFIRTALKHSEV